MISIIIVDDEVGTRRIIARYLNSIQGYTVLGEASDGIEALALMELKQPDVLITDICMPKMDGLELVRRIRQANYATKVIIMSGYSDFEYAKQAIKYNVEEYLLKPFLPSSLDEILTGLGKKLETRAYRKESEEDIKNNFLNSIVKGEIDTVEILKGIKNLQLPIQGKVFLLGFFRFFSKTTDELPLGKNQLWVYLQKLLPSALPPCINAVCFVQPKERLSILFSFEGCSEEKFKEELTKLFQVLSTRMEKELGSSVWCALSAPFNTLSHSPDSNAEAEIAWKQYCSLSLPCNFYAERVQSQAEADALTEQILHLENKCALSLSLGEENTPVLLDSLFCSLEELALLNYHAMQVNLLSFVIRISNLVNTAEMDTLSLQDFNRYLNDAKAIGSLFETKYLLKKAVATALRIRRNDKKPLGEVIVSSIKEKIALNLDNEKFTIEDAIFGLDYSNNYIRHIFSQTEGKSIKEYLITERMQRAKLLLEDSALPIKEIAERTGYRNQHYFSFSFKDFWGIAPSDWRAGKHSQDLL
jgi:two-component system response regulator YesN